MSKEALLLTNSFEVLDFVSERKILKLLFRDKVDVIFNWEDEIITWTSGQIKLPSVIKLTYPITRNFYRISFSRAIVIKRDESRCQYCDKKLTGHQITVDHILPTSRGGRSNFTNCVVCCKKCNTFKGNKTLEEAGMKLLRQPISPTFIPNDIETNGKIWHPEWNFFLKQVNDN